MNRFAFIARNIREQIPDKAGRKQAALNVSKMRGFNDFYTLQRFITLCDGE